MLKVGLILGISALFITRDDLTSWGVAVEPGSVNPYAPNIRKAEAANLCRDLLPEHSGVREKLVRTAALIRTPNTNAGQTILR
jgi:hypothetical protein